MTEPGGLRPGDGDEGAPYEGGSPAGGSAAGGLPTGGARARGRARGEDARGADAVRPAHGGHAGHPAKAGNAAHAWTAVHAVHAEEARTAEEAGTAEEDELRVLLERVVPQLPAPAQRLESVRARLRRRRRRRAAGVSTAAVLAVAAAGLLVPGLRMAAGSPDAAPRTTALAPPASAAGPASRPATGARPSATDTSSTSSATTAPASPTSPPPTPTSQPGYRLLPFDQAGGLRLQVPAGWFTLVPPGSTTVYVSSQALALPPDKCAHPLDGFCTPLERLLAGDGVLVALDLQSGKNLAAKFRATQPAVTAQTVLDACRSVGGTAELGAVLPGPAGADAVLTATACLSRPSDPQEARVRVLMTTADFS